MAKTGSDRDGERRAAGAARAVAATAADPPTSPDDRRDRRKGSLRPDASSGRKRGGSRPGADARTAPDAQARRSDRPRRREGSGLRGRQPGQQADPDEDRRGDLGLPRPEDRGGERLAREQRRRGGQSRIAPRVAEELGTDLRSGRPAPAAS